GRGTRRNILGSASDRPVDGTPSVVGEVVRPGAPHRDTAEGALGIGRQINGGRGRDGHGGSVPRLMTGQWAQLPYRRTSRRACSAPTSSPRPPRRNLLPAANPDLIVWIDTETTGLDP